MPRKRVGWENELAVLIPIMDEQLINFEDEDKDMHNVVLIVQGRRFFCSKIILAKNSGIMKCMFSGPYEERNKEEIELFDVSIVDFNNFLLLIHRALEVNDDNLVGLLKLSNMWLAPNPLKKCRDFLMHKSGKPIKDRHNLSVQYDFEDVKCTEQFMDLSEQFKIDMSCYGSIARYANNSCKNFNAELNHIVQP